MGKTTLTFSANINVLSVSATLLAYWYYAKWKIRGKYVHGNGNYSRCFTRTWGLISPLIRFESIV